MSSGVGWLGRPGRRRSCGTGPRGRLAGLAGPDGLLGQRRRPGLPGDELADDGRQPLRVERLRQDLVVVRGHVPVACRCIRSVPSQADERHRRQLLAAPQGAADLVAVPAGQRQADEEGVGPDPRGHGFEEGRPVLEGVDPELRLGEDELGRLLDRRAGVGHDDLVGHVNPQKSNKIVNLIYPFSGLHWRPALNNRPRPSSRRAGPRSS